jgi:adenosylcobinamide-phosphate synthase
MLSTASVLLALLLDRLLGEPRRFHPLIDFGSLADMVERMVYADSKLGGLLALIGLVLPLALLAGIFSGWLDHWIIGAVKLIQRALLIWVVAILAGGWLIP